eukprot:COSAG06_NODE_64197_length_260_cov_0.639752_1_plen_86_part_11
MPLQDELRGLKVSALRERAAADGIAQADIQAARDKDDVKPALIALILEHASDLDVGALRKLTKSALHQRAKADGVTEADFTVAREI